MDFAEFYAAHKDSCLRAVVATGVDRAAAEEAVAEAFARAWSHWPTVGRLDAPRGWVVRVALNTHVSRWRKSRREVELGFAADVAVATNHEERDDLILAVQALPQRQRQVVALRVFLDLDTAQTADVLGIATGTVTAHFHRAMTTLRANYKETCP